MASGDLTATAIGTFNISSAALVTAINAVNLPTTTDNLHIIPMGTKGMVTLLKVVRAA